MFRSDVQKCREIAQNQGKVKALANSLKYFWVNFNDGSEGIDDNCGNIEQSEYGVSEVLCPFLAYWAI